jgi:N utilization substance protein A
VELGEGIIQKLITAGITTVESLADMTPEQLEEIPGIGEKTLEKISVAVRHYFGHFEEGEEGYVPEASTEESGEEPSEGNAAKSAAADTEDISVGRSEIETADAAVDTAEAEAENSQDVLQEAESERAAEAEDELEESSAANEELAEIEAEEQSETAAELAVDNVPAAKGDEEDGA